MRKTNDLVGIIDGFRNDLIEFSQELIATPSENPPGNEKAVAALISQKLVDLGLGTPRIVAKAEDRPNLVYKLDLGESGPVLMYNGHMDTKPVGDRDKWNSDPFDPIIKDGKLYGLGSADMKSALAAIVFSAAALQELSAKGKGSLLLIFTADEEAGGSFGAEYVAREGNIVADVGLVAEPVGIHRNWTSIDTISRGEICFRVKVRGTQLHSSIADLVPSVNASVKMAKTLIRMDEELNLNFDPHPLCPQGVTIGTGIMVNGGTCYGMLPHYAEFAMELRTLPGMTLESVKVDLDAFISLLREEDPTIDIEVEFEPPPLMCIDPVIVDDEEPFIVHLQEASKLVLGRRPPLGVFPAWTDARFFKEIADINTIPGYGPGLLTVTHTPNEHISVDTIIEACKIFALAGWSYLTS